jgi:hypothetical protein
MKRAAAIVLSLMFVWLQALASAPMSFRPAPEGCACCDCKRNCCVKAATPAAQLPAATSVVPSSQNSFSLFAPTLVTWALPVTTPLQISPSASAPLPVPTVPLFTRHCALLI